MWLCDLYYEREMPTVNMEIKRINFIDFWPGFDKENNLFCNILREKYLVDISEQPDYIFASVSGNYGFTDYDCVRILYTGEPFSPDFNVFDYAIGFDPIELKDEKGSDRYYRFPYCFYDEMGYGLQKLSRGLTREEAQEVLQEKKYFCNFIYSHPSAKGERETILNLLSQYKRVESSGSFLNNMKDGFVVPRAKKEEFLRLSKFTIACESIIHPGFVTEKISDALYANSIPIYYGSNYVKKEFNPDAFIYLGDYNSIEEGIEKVIEIDRNDEKYISMLMQPKLIVDHYYENLYDGLRAFLFHIFDQDKEEALRRLGYYVQKNHEQKLKDYSLFYNSPEYKTWKLRKRAQRKIIRMSHIHL